MAINAEDFDTVVDLYTEDASLMVKPGCRMRNRWQAWHVAT